MVHNKELDRKQKCHDCKKKLIAHEKFRCDHCRALDNNRHARRRILHRGNLCRDCFYPISLESNGNYLTCTNCRHLRDLRRI